MLPFQSPSIAAHWAVVWDTEQDLSPVLQYAARQTARQADSIRQEASSQEVGDPNDICERVAARSIYNTSPARRPQPLSARKAHSQQQLPSDARFINVAGMAHRQAASMAKIQPVARTRSVSMPEADLGRLLASMRASIANDDPDTLCHNEHEAGCTSDTESIHTESSDPDAAPGSAHASPRGGGGGAEAPALQPKTGHMKWLKQLSMTVHDMRAGKSLQELLLTPASRAACAAGCGGRSLPLMRERSSSCSDLSGGMARVQQEMLKLQAVASDAGLPEEQYRVQCALRLTKSRAGFAPWEMAQLKLMGAGLMLPGYNSLNDYHDATSDEAAAASISHTLRGIDSMVRRVMVTVTDANKAHVEREGGRSKSGRAPPSGGEARRQLPRVKSQGNAAGSSRKPPTAGSCL